MPNRPHLASDFSSHASEELHPPLTWVNLLTTESLAIAARGMIEYTKLPRLMLVAG